MELAHEGSFSACGRSNLIGCTKQETPLSTQEQHDAAVLESILAASRDAIIVTDADDRIAAWNPAAERLFGYTAPEAIGQPVSTVLSDSDGEASADIGDQPVEAGIPAPHRSVQRRKDGAQIEVELASLPIRSGSGARTGTVAVVRDISEQVRAEAVLEEMVSQLQLANHRLSQLSATKSDFVSTISHEFRTPLTSIQGFSELLESEDVTLDEAREFVRAINQNASRLARLVGDVLDLDALETGHREIRTERLDLNVLVRQGLAALAPTTATHAIEVELSADVPAIRGDADLLGRVIANLVTNAVRYSPSGSRIVISSTSRQGDAEFVVADEGIGVPARHRETIFSRYGRIARPEQMGIEGTGLGLPLARHILEVHNGRIWVEPNTPSGSVFHVVIPAAESQAGT